ncbi:Xaa-Pro aminopeptidase [Alicyclobacillus contaminans]|uniref:aminopeptidase P family protein n=1 Tax=Alicyclobacillus contaminans TaxID=392016 RepID=UPI000413822B|nr:aminopeptidase P family protein [Alicyclobacillus contaminans]GMA50802.1 Xaa-Pro aminopeptidase [Alicyclobacillus contaminans]
MLNSTIYAERRAQFAAQMEEHSVCVLFSGTAPHKSEDMEYPYTPNRNFYYLTGIARPNMILLLTKQAENVSEMLFIEPANPDLEKWTGRRLRAAEAMEISGVTTVHILDHFSAVFGRLLARSRCDAAYLDLARAGWDIPLSKAHEFAAELQRKHPYLVIRDAHRMLAGMRMFKREEEVACIRTAIDLTRQGIENMLTHARPGMMEYELEAYYEFPLRRQGVREPGFASIVASGPNGVILHYEENNRRTEDGDLVLIDLGAQYGYYSADISRTFPVNGKFTDRQKQIYNLVLDVEERVIAAVRPGVTWRALNEWTKQWLAEGLKGLGLITQDEELSRYYYHSVGHQLGLNVHDVTALSDADPLQPGMVITIEPGLYIAEEGIGVRIEDDVLVTSDGHENLSKNILKTVEEIEAFMAQRPNS